MKKASIRSTMREKKQWHTHFGIGKMVLICSGIDTASGSLLLPACGLDDRLVLRLFCSAASGDKAMLPLSSRMQKELYYIQSFFLMYPNTHALWTQGQLCNLVPHSKQHTNTWCYWISHLYQISAEKDKQTFWNHMESTQTYHLAVVWIFNKEAFMEAGAGLAGRN